MEHAHNATKHQNLWALLLSRREMILQLLLACLSAPRKIPV